MQVSRPAPTELLAQVRRRRAELRAAMGVLEQALGSPAGGRDWVGKVRNALIQVDADFRMHVGVMVAFGAVLYFFNLGLAWVVLSRPR